MSTVHGQGVPQMPMEPSGPKKSEDKSFFSSIASTISNLFFSKTSTTSPTEIEMTDVSTWGKSAPKGKEEVEVHTPTQELPTPQQDVRTKEEGMRQIADSAPKTVSDSATQQTAKKISPEKAAELRGKLLPEGGTEIKRGKVKFGPVKPGLSREAPEISGGRTPVPKPEAKARAWETDDVTFRTMGTEQETKKAALLAKGGDLKTKQGPTAHLQAFRANGCIASAMARAERPALAQNAMKEFVGCVDSIDQMIDEADLSNKDHCDFLNNLAGLMHKGFNVDIGGMGSLSNKQGWSSDWSKLGKGDGAFKPGDAKNDQVKSEFKAMLAYYRNNAAAHFSPDRHIGSREMAAGQVASTVGQFIQDFTHEGRYPKPLREKFFDIMVNNGLVDASQDFSKLDGFKNTMRANPLLAEVKNSIIQGEIVDGLSKGKTKEEMLSLIKGELVQLNTDGKLKSDEIDALANRILERYTDKVKGQQINSDKTGARGRIPFAPNAPDWQGQIGKTLAGQKGNPKSFAIAPHRSQDDLHDNGIRSALDPNDPQVKSFYEAVTGPEDMLKHGGSPLVPLRLGKGLEGEFVKLMDPGRLMKEAVQEILEEDLTAQGYVENPLQTREEFIGKNPQLSALSGMLEQVGTPEFKEGYQGIVGKIEVTFNAATRQKMSLKDFSEMKSVASRMFEKDLRTICSISGTTVDIVLSKITTMGDAEMQKLLQPLLDHLDGKQPDPLGTPGTEEGAKFKEFASSISMFMQAGNYHTAAEVVGGLFIAARGLSCSKDDNIDIPKTVELFEKLMTEFAEKPETFLAAKPEDVAKLKSAEQQFLTDLATAENTRIASTQEAVR